MFVYVYYKFMLILVCCPMQQRVETVVLQAGKDEDSLHEVDKVNLLSKSSVVVGS